jgi:hypothetical protein
LQQSEKTPTLALTEMTPADELLAKVERLLQPDRLTGA